MADFCQQCSIEVFGEDLRDFAGLTTAEDMAQDLAALVLCEGCGPIQVDPDGRCISSDCSAAKNPNHHKEEKKP